MGRRGPPGLSPAERADMWCRWKAGYHLREIARAFGRDHGSIRGLLAQRGGIIPSVRTRGSLALTLIEREDISRELALLLKYGLPFDEEAELLRWSKVKNGAMGRTWIRTGYRCGRPTSCGRRKRSEVRACLMNSTRCATCSRTPKATTAACAGSP